MCVDSDCEVGPQRALLLCGGASGALLAPTTCFPASNSLLRLYHAMIVRSPVSSIKPTPGTGVTKHVQLLCEEAETAARPAWLPDRSFHAYRRGRRHRVCRGACASPGARCLSVRFAGDVRRRQLLLVVFPPPSRLGNVTMLMMMLIAKLLFQTQTAQLHIPMHVRNLARSLSLYTHSPYIPVAHAKGAGATAPTWHRRTRPAANPQHCVSAA